MGFSAFSVSKTVVPRVRKYIQEQEIRHNKLSFEEEMKLFEKPALKGVSFKKAAFSLPP